MNPIIADSVLGTALGRYCEQEEVTDLGTICALLFVARAVRDAGTIPPVPQLLARSGAQIRGVHRAVSKLRMQKKCQAVNIEQFLYSALMGRAGYVRTKQNETVRALAAEFNQLADLYMLAPGLRISDEFAPPRSAR